MAINYKGYDWEEISPGVWYSPQQGWATRDTNPSVVSALEAGGKDPASTWQYFEPTGAWQGGYVNNGVSLLDSQWNQIPETLRAQFGTAYRDGKHRITFIGTNDVTASFSNRHPSLRGTTITLVHQPGIYAMQSRANQQKSAAEKKLRDF